MKLLDGTALAASIRAELKKKISSPVGLAFLLVGHHSPSETYVKMKQRACQEVGINSSILRFPDTTPEETVKQEIDRLNHDPSIHGILIQLPLPPHLNLLSSIDPRKDVDGFHPLNAGKLLLGDPTGFVPCTPLGIQTLLVHAGIPIEGSHVVIVGRSNIVGKPLAALLMQKRAHANATVTLAHSQTVHLEEITRQADILIAASGLPGLIKSSHVRKGAVVIDVGINRVGGKIVGDVLFSEVKPLVSAITPVPGGIGPMTIAMLLSNVYKASC
jgi:methylenetetrahydrofolate dehydrogenase (NADP+)/methenyltetrahydrofolate cyclohydrolase